MKQRIMEADRTDCRDFILQIWVRTVDAILHLIWRGWVLWLSSHMQSFSLRVVEIGVLLSLVLSGGSAIT